MAFFPCIYFETIQMCVYQLTAKNNAHKSQPDRIVDAIDRLQNRTHFHTLLYKLLWAVEKYGLRLIIENPATTPSYLIGTQNFPSPSIIDKDRTRRGDYFKKPTAYWFFGCEPTNGYSMQKDKEVKRINDCKSAPRAGLCSEERSLISPDYARNFIHDFILGKKQEITQLTLFD